MKIIVGLGNPGKQYQNTRHNTGFLAIDFLIGNCLSALSSRPKGKLSLDPELETEGELGNFQKNFSTFFWETDINSQKVFLVKPLTSMNEAGTAVKKICDFYKINVTKDLIVIHDDVDLPFGEIRTTDSSSSAGHKGVQDIIDKLGMQDFHRIRIGVESRTDKTIPPTDDFVLQNFSKKELAKLKTNIFPRVKVEIKKYLELGTWNLELANKKTA